MQHERRTVTVPGKPSTLLLAPEDLDALERRSRSWLEYNIKVSSVMLAAGSSLRAAVAARAPASRVPRPLMTAHRTETPLGTSG